MFARLLPLLLLLLTLLLGQLGGVLHALNHDKIPDEQGQSLDFKCSLCDEYAQLGHALTTPAQTFAALPSPEVRPTAWLVWSFPLFFVAFAARAPPGLNE